MAEEVKIIVTATDNFSGVLGNFGNIITGIRSAVSLATDAFRTFVEPVIDFGKESAFTAARVDELALVNKILAQNAGLAAESIPGLVESLRDSGIQADVAQETIAQMIRAELDLANATDIARVAQDAAVIAGTNSSETLDNIIYGITTLNPLVLRHAGIIVDLQLAYKAYAEENDRAVDSLTTAEKQQIAMNEVLNAGTAIAGSYEEAMSNAFKQFGSFDRYINDIQVSIGDYLQPALNDAVFGMADFLKWLGKAVEEGGALQPILQNLADAAEYFSTKFVEALDFLKGYIESGNGNIWDVMLQSFQDVDWGLVTDAIVSIIDNVEWSRVGKAFGNGLAEALGIAADEAGEVNWWDVIVTPIIAAGEFVAGWFAGFWNIEVASSLEEALQQWKGFFQGLWGAISSWGAGIVSGISTWAANAVNAILEFGNNIVRAVKDFFGIASPSTVFFQIGVDLISGLVLGIGSMINPMLDFIKSVVNLLLQPFQPVLDLLGISTGGDIIGTSDTISFGGGATPTGTLGGQVINNYFYGPVYMGSSTDTIRYDCPPSPLMTAGSGQLVLNP